MPGVCSEKGPYFVCMGLYGVECYMYVSLCRREWYRIIYISFGELDEGLEVI